MSQLTVVLPNDRRWKIFFVLALVLSGLTVAVYSSACSNDFVVWDDNQYVYREPQVLNGLRPAGLLWATTARVCGNWHPLTMMSLQLDAQLFGTGPVGFHRTAIVIHAVNVALAFYAIWLLTGCPWKSLIVAALFAVHPLRVESVAWISERKDVLSGFFFFLTLIAYAYYVRTPSVLRYLIVAICLALGLCSKSMLVTTPCVLLLLDYWPLGRLRFLASESRRIRNLLLEKVPLLGLAAIVSVLTVVYQKEALIYLTGLPLERRVENAVRGCAAYLGQTFWPTRLSHFYPIPVSSPLAFAAALGLLVVLTGVACWQRIQRPFLLVGWFWFLGMLVPVCGLIQVGFQQHADRYMYLPQIGLFLAVVWGVADLVKKSRAATLTSACLITGLLLGCGFLTVKQISVWRDTKSLWQQALRSDPQNRAALFSLCNFAYAEGNSVEGLRLANDLIQIEDRSSHEFLSRVSDVSADHGEFETSLRALDKLVEYQPDERIPESELYLHRSESLAALGRWDEAANGYRRVTQLAPQVVPLRFCLAHALAKAGRSKESDEVRQAALRQLPNWPEGALRTAWKLSTSPESGQNDRFKAVCMAEEANFITGGRQPGCLDVLAIAYAANAQFEQAIVTAQLAIQRAENERQVAYAAAIRGRLQLFKDHRPYLETRPAATSINQSGSSR